MATRNLDLLDALGLAAVRGFAIVAFLALVAAFLVTVFVRGFLYRSGPDINDPTGYAAALGRSSPVVSDDEFRDVTAKLGEHLRSHVRVLREDAYTSRGKGVLVDWALLDDYRDHDAADDPSEATS